jgi:hypothetical protein
MRMFKSTLIAVVALSTFSLPAFATQAPRSNPCFETAVQTVQNGLIGSQYTVGKILDESNADSAIFSAEILDSSQTFVGTYVVVMSPETCAVQSANFNNATP